jgi:hypothetical protein
MRAIPISAHVYAFRSLRMEFVRTTTPVMTAVVGENYLVLLLLRYGVRGFPMIFGASFFESGYPGLDWPNVGVETLNQLGVP